MNATEFAFWLRGVMSTTMTPGDQAALVIAEVRRGLGSEPVKAAPPQMTAIRVPQFCIHNINVAEYCVGCCGKYTAGKMRAFAVTLPIGTPLVYIPLGSQKESDNGDHASGVETDAPDA